MCVLSACKGACCVQGESGAPLRKEEIGELEAALPHVWEDLRPAARRAIEENGVWESNENDDCAVPCTDDGVCVFATFDGPVAICSLHRAYEEGQSEFVKPISCHLFPLRIERIGEFDVVNVQRLRICRPARKEGRRAGVELAEALQQPLTRAYGAAWYEKFYRAWSERRQQAGLSPSRIPEKAC